MSLVNLNNNHPKIKETDEIKEIDYKSNLSKMMNICSLDTLKVMGNIFLKLGFTSLDEIEIFDVSSNAYDMVRLNFLVNGIEYKGCFHRRYGKNCLGFSLVDNTKSQYDYMCFIDDENLENIDVMLKGYTIFDNGCMVICKKSYDGIKYVVSSDKTRRGMTKQTVSLDVKCFDVITTLNKNNKSFYSPLNEKSLIAYLCGCSYPIKIDKIYNDLVNMCFNGDVRDYPLFDLEVMTIRNIGYDNRVITDIVKLKNGELVSFGMMQSGKLKESSLENVGGAVIFNGNGYFDYHLFVPKKGFNSFNYMRLGEIEETIDYNLVKKVGQKLIYMFPEDAERMFGDYLVSEKAEQGQLDFFTDSSCKSNNKILRVKKEIE